MNNLNYINLLIILFLFVSCQSLFSKYHKKCKLFQKHKGRQIGSLIQEKVAVYPVNYYIRPLFETTKKLQYKHIDYFYYEYVGAGGSGQVYLVEDLKTKTPKIFKRFFKQKIPEFQEENFIMQKLNYEVQWAKDIQNGIPNKTDYQKDINEHKQVPTIAIYPSKQSISLRDIQFYAEELPIIFFKILMELDKTHRHSIIHNDIKMGNILINENSRNFKFFDTQLIDWNLASFYYLGVEYNGKKGTQCYYSPEQLMRGAHITPAIDVWALAVVMFSFITNKKPFFTDCKQNNLKAIASLVGIQKIIQMHRKYRYPIQNQYYDLLEQYAANPKSLQAKNLRQRIPHEKKQIFSDNLIDLFEKMLVVDPEQRITISELIYHPYFKQAKKIPIMFEEKRKSQRKQKKQSKKELKLDNSKKIQQSIKQVHIKPKEQKKNDKVGNQNSLIPIAQSLVNKDQNNKITKNQKEGQQMEKNI